MSTRDFSTVVARVNPSAPGCSFPMLLQYVRDAAIAVCERSLAYRYEQPVFALTPGVHRYTYPRPPDTAVAAVLLSTVNDTPLQRMTLDAAVAQYPAWTRTSTTAADIATYGGAPHTVVQVLEDRFVLIPAPDAAQTYTMRMIYALKPTRDASGMDEGVLDVIETAVVHKALQELLVLPNMHWTDRDLASYHARQYLARMQELRADANLGSARGSLTVRAVPVV